MLLDFLPAKWLRKKVKQPKNKKNLNRKYKHKNKAESKEKQSCGEVSKINALKLKSTKVVLIKVVTDKKQNKAVDK